MALFLVLLLLALVFVGIGFVAKWVFILAVICAILAAFSYFSGHRNTV
jgi:4-amino-4-deoxy-L-arabinose transferase-like glycosyltransferase